MYLYVEGESCLSPHAKAPSGSEEYYTVWNELVLQPGEQYTIPANTKHWFQAGKEGDVISEFSTPADDSIYTEPMEAKQYYDITGVDALAVAIGTAHGAYKAKPKLDFERLTAIAEAVSVPLVLHGGSGLSDDDFRRTIACGISKINIFTDINCAAARAAHEGYQNGKGMTDLMPDIVKAVKIATMQKMEVFGCCGRA